jgi:hypothetical protein
MLLLERGVDGDISLRFISEDMFSFPGVAAVTSVAIE